MPEEIRVKPTTLLVIVLLLMVVGVIFYQAYYAAPPPVEKYKYTTGLTVKFKIFNVGRSQLVTTATVQIYPSGADPFARTFNVKPITSASYDSTNGYWTAPLDAGSYVILITGVSGAYPEKITVRVPGTNDEDLEVWMQPSQLNVYARAAVTDSKAILYWNGTTWLSTDRINTAVANKWMITYTLMLAEDTAPYGVLKAGRIYISKYSGLTITSANMDGTAVSVIEDADAADDGMTGFYIEFNELNAGEVHRLDLIIEETGTVSAGTMTITVFEYYECLRTALRTWTPVTEPITVQ
ncbi:MAG: hypothetical protein NZ932_04010 [Candidatus Bathyarchaeota archaeon]|nr:hypothetical protein [Candidatus Bathyarchaeota archaeon]MDW8022366.1 hypothetical protein [Nitrososphaerota archaeon]